MLIWLLVFLTVVLHNHELTNQRNQACEAWSFLAFFLSFENLINVELLIFRYWNLFLILMRFEIVKLFQSGLKVSCSWKICLLDAICIEPELLIQYRISLVRSFHVLIDLGNRHNKVDVEVVDHIDDEAEGDDEACVFEVCKLDVHSAELNAPSNIWSLWWWWFES